MIHCALICILLANTPADGKDWPQWRGANRDGIWRETGIIQKFEGSEIKARWRVPISNGYSGPTVANGRVYVTDRVREPKSQERVHCYEWDTGKPVWTYAYDCDYKGVQVPDGPRASVTIDDGCAYTFGATGILYCFDAATGAVKWNRDLNSQYKIRLPDWGIAAAPIVEGNVVVVMASGSPDACLIAFNKKTGHEAWHAFADRATYSAPIIIDQAGKRVLVCWTAERIIGLNPLSGQLFWVYKWDCKETVDPCVTPVVLGDLMFFTSVYEGSLMLRLQQDKLGVTKVWEDRGHNERETGALKSMITTPVLKGGYLYGIDYFGELRCIESGTGKRVWENLTVVPKANWASAHLIQNGDRVWILNEKGQLIISKVSPKGYEEISRAQLIKPTLGQLNQRGGVVWSHPAFAYKHIFIRNDEELICASLKAEG